MNDAATKDAIASAEAASFLEEVAKNPGFRAVMQSKDKERIAAELHRIGVKFLADADRDDAVEAIIAVDWSGLDALAGHDLGIRMG